jgi:hypothetical protein
MYLLGSSLVAAVLDGLFEHPGEYSPVVPYVRTIEILAGQNSSSAAW